MLAGAARNPGITWFFLESLRAGFDSGGRAFTSSSATSAPIQGHRNKAAAGHQQLAHIQMFSKAKVAFFRPCADALGRSR